MRAVDEGLAAPAERSAKNSLLPSVVVAAAAAADDAVKDFFLLTA